MLPCVLCSSLFTRVRPSLLLQVLISFAYIGSIFLQACEAADYLVKMPDRIRKLAERSNARKQKNKGQTSPFAWVFDRPVELV